MRAQPRSKRHWVGEPIGLQVRELPKPIDVKALFGNDHPLELEIGVGKGTFLVEQAHDRPHINFLGIERARRYWMYTSDRLRRRRLFNTRIVLADALYFLSEFVSDSRFSAVHVHFPDPWPKKRHHKRRLIQEPFLGELERILEPGGRLQVVTDHSDYYQQIQRIVGASNLTIAAYLAPGTGNQSELVGSNFERKYRREGRPIYALAAVKPPATYTAAG